MPTFYEAMNEDSKRRWILLIRLFKGIEHIKENPSIKTDLKLESLDEIAILMKLLDSQIRERYD